MVTKGTFLNTSQASSYEPRFVIALKRYGRAIGVTFFDLTTLKFFIGQFQDDEFFSCLRTLVCQIRPTEVLHERELSNSEVMKMLKNSPAAPVFTLIPPKNCWGLIKTCSHLESYVGRYKEWP